MATQLQLRRGTTSQHSSFTGALAEPTVDTDTGTLIIHDGSTAGGIRHVREKDARLTGSVALEGDISPSQITSDQNDYNPTNLSTATILRVNSDATRQVTGLSGGRDGRCILLVNVGSKDLFLPSESTASSAANRFTFPSNRMVVALRPADSIALQYDATSSRWRPVQTPGLSNMAAVDNPVQTGRVIQLIKEQGTTNLISVGIQAPTETNAGTSVDGTQFGVKRYITTSTTDDKAGLITPALFRAGYNADCLGVTSVGNTITNYRFWLACTNTDLGGVGAPTTQHVAGFRYDTSVDGTAFWRTVSCDGSSNVTTTTTTYAIVAATFYKFRIVFVASGGSPSEIRFFIDDNLLAIHTANFPGSGTDLKLQAVCSNVSIASARRFEFSRFGVLIP